LGLIHFDAGRYESARIAFEAAVETARGEGMRRAANIQLARTARRQGRAVDSAMHLREARSLSGPVTSAAEWVALEYNEAVLARVEGRHDAADALFAAAEAREPVLELAWRIAYQRGLLAEARREPALGERHFRRAIELLEGIRDGLKLEALKASFLEEKRRPYEAVFALHAPADDAGASALAAMEATLARAFMDAFARAGIDTDIGERVRSMQRIGPAVRGGALLAPRDVPDLLSTLAGNHLVAFFEARGVVWRLVIARREVSLDRVGPDVAELRGAVDAFTAAPDDADHAGRLGAWLFPEGALPPPGAPVHLVLDGVVASLPIPALRIGGEVLAARHPTARVPSATALAALLRAPRGGGGPALVLGDATGDLPNARREAERVARALGVRPLLGAAATADALRAPAELLHLATHTGVGPAGAWIGLADGRLDSAGIVGWRRPPRLAVLASCASAASPRRGMWGSLAGAFLAAGTRDVVAALWSVDDAATRRFVEAFYAAGGADRPGTALSRVQAQAAAAGHPAREWAGFTLFGGVRF